MKDIERLKRELDQMMSNLTLLQTSILDPASLPERERDPERHLAYLELDIQQIRRQLSEAAKEER